ncbi:MAG: TIGR03086 family metal-binding protein [Thermocrispum sp.]
MHDLAPAARRLDAVVGSIGDEQLASRTPCENYRVSGLMDHVLGLTAAFRMAAEKDPGASANPPKADPSPEAELPAGWRERVGQQLDELVAAWQRPAAWEGETEAGGVTLPAPVMATVALQELVVHAWDLAKATGQPFDVDQANLEALFGFLDGAVDENGTPGLFGPPVQLPADAPLLERTIALTGRDPAWRPAA